MQNNSPTSRKLNKHQFWVLFKTGLKLDWRGASNPFVGYGTGKQNKSVPGMLVVLGLTGLMSLFMGIVFLRTPDYFSGLVISASGMMFLIGLQILMDFGNIVVAPDDYNIIAPKPVNSKTFYYSKLCHLVAYITMLSLAASIIPAIFAFLRFGIWWHVIVLILNFWLSVFFMSILMMIAYTLVLKFVDRRRLERMLGYMQTVMVLFVSLSWITMMTNMSGNEEFRHLDILGFMQGNIKYFPSYWFAAPVIMLIDGWSIGNFLWSLPGYGMLLVLTPIALSYLSITYAESIGRAEWTKSVEEPKARRKSRVGWLRKVLTHEDLAILSLTRANYKHDIKFRLGILSAVWIPIIYLLLGLVLHGGETSDLFAVDKNRANMLHILFTLAMGLLPFLIGSAIVGSKDWQASWVFFSIPVDRMKLVNSVSHLVMLVSILPLAILEYAIYIILIGNPFHAFLHTINLVAYGLCALAFLNLIVVELPFSSKPASGGLIGSVMGPFMIWLIGSTVPLIIFIRVGYANYLNWFFILIGLMVLRQILVYLRSRRVRKKILAWQFLG
ncbi:MAG: hypothetical protein V3V99_10880 [candidate division Zixibacteria bacterium]